MHRPLSLPLHDLYTNPLRWEAMRPAMAGCATIIHNVSSSNLLLKLALGNRIIQNKNHYRPCEETKMLEYTMIAGK